MDIYSRSQQVNQTQLHKHAEAQMSRSEYESFISNMEYHNLCTTIRPPRSVGRLLGLNHSFCLESPLPDQDISKTMSRARRDGRLKNYLGIHGEDLPPRTFNRELYIASKWEPGEEYRCPEVEARLNAFEQRLISLDEQNQQQRPRTNIASRQRRVLNHLMKNDELMTLKTDKGLGIALIERSIYNQRLWIE